MEEQKPQMPAEEAPKAQSGGPEKNTGMAIIAYILFFIPLLTGAHKDPFVKYHVKQGLVIFCLGVIIWLVGMALPWYWAFSFYWIIQLLQLGLLVLVILGIMNAAGGKQEPLPVVGKFADMFKF
ncbi:MAG: hypothetical protein ABII19_02750 [Patescibacteria group bacterium]